MDIEKFTKYVEEINEHICEKLKDDEETLQFYLQLVFCFNTICEQNKKQKEVIDKVKLTVKGTAYGGSEDYYMEKISKINELLKEVSE